MTHEQPMNHDEYIPPREAARILCVEESTLRRWYLGGLLHQVDIRRTAGGQRRYRRADIERIAADPHAHLVPAEPAPAPAPEPAVSAAPATGPDVTWNWQGMQPNGRRVSGTIEAATIQDAQKRLQEMGVSVEDIVPGVIASHADTAAEAEAMQTWVWRGKNETGELRRGKVQATSYDAAVRAVEKWGIHVHELTPAVITSSEPANAFTPTAGAARDQVPNSSLLGILGKWIKGQPKDERDEFARWLAGEQLESPDESEDDAAFDAMANAKPRTQPEPRPEGVSLSTAIGLDVPATHEFGQGRFIHTKPVTPEWAKARPASRTLMVGAGIAMSIHSAYDTTLAGLRRHARVLEFAERQGWQLRLIGPGRYELTRRFDDCEQALSSARAIGLTAVSWQPDLHLAWQLLLRTASAERHVTERKDPEPTHIPAGAPDDDETYERVAEHNDLRHLGSGEFIRPRAVPRYERKLRPATPEEIAQIEARDAAQAEYEAFAVANWERVSALPGSVEIEQEFWIQDAGDMRAVAEQMDALEAMGWTVEDAGRDEFSASKSFDNCYEAVEDARVCGIEYFTYVPDEGGWKLDVTVGDTEEEDHMGMVRIEGRKSA